MTTIDNQKHGKLRRILNQGLSDAHIRTMDPELRRVTATFVHTVTEAQDRFHPMSESVSGEGDGWSAAKNMAQWCNIHVPSFHHPYFGRHANWARIEYNL